MKGLIAVLLLAQGGNPDGVAVPEIPLFQPPPVPFVAPGRLFLLQLPTGWDVALHDKDPYTVDFRAANRPGEAVLQIRRMLVPAGAHPRQLMLNAIEQRLGKLPHFKLAQKRDVVMAGSKAASVVGTYAFQGNLQYPRALEEVYVVAGNEAFIFHFECFEPSAPAFVNDLERFYGTFVPRPPALTDTPYAAPEQSHEIPF